MPPGHPEHAPHNPFDVRADPDSTCTASRLRQSPGLHLLFEPEKIKERGGKGVFGCDPGRPTLYNYYAHFFKDWIEQVGEGGWHGRSELDINNLG